MATLKQQAAGRKRKTATRIHNLTAAEIAGVGNDFV